MTVIAALRHECIDAPWPLDGLIDDESFRVYVEQALVPTRGRGDVTIIDNFGRHEVRQSAGPFATLA